MTQPPDAPNHSDPAARSDEDAPSPAPDDAPRQAAGFDRLKREAFDPVTFGFKLTVPRWVPWSAFGVAMLIFISYYTLDLPLTVELHDMSPTLKRITEYVTELGSSTWYLLALPPLILVAWLARRRALAGVLLHLFLAVAAAGLLSNALKFLFGRYRPGIYFDHGLWGFNGFELGYNVNSFPSGHSAVIGAVAAALALALPRAWPACLALALIVGFTRVMTGSHWLSDVVAGLYLGALAALALRALLRDRGLYPTAK